MFTMRSMDAPAALSVTSGWAIVVDAPRQTEAARMAEPTMTAALVVLDRGMSPRDDRSRDGRTGRGHAARETPPAVAVPYAAHRDAISGTELSGRRAFAISRARPLGPLSVQLPSFRLRRRSR
jgi:hypothetical protein